MYANFLKTILRKLFNRKRKDNFKCMHRFPSRGNFLQQRYNFGL